ncbi:M50 family metallopeptidase [Sphingomonas jaspsi]|uniref:M50 family metallopeptidase n=1 Tax=Sphingomonas jaspsi TaxID=392409 RepID=UPI0004AEFA1A|nr:M50 family metallopeptidase [Sphingomonas jaspsi]
MLAQPPIWFIAIAFVCAIGPLVFFHELGHYWVARWFGIGASQFSIGFGRELTGWTDKRGTRWKIGWMPLGGYVRFIGDMNAASQADANADLSSEEQAVAFHNRPWWQRFLVVLAGPVANFVLAIAIFATFFASYGFPNTPPVAASIAPGSAAEAAQLHVGDRIVSVAGQATRRFEDIQRIVSIRPGEQIDLMVERNQAVRTVPVRLGSVEQVDEFGQKYRIGQLGIGVPQREFEKISVGAAIPAAAGYAFDLTRSMVDGLVQILTGQRSTKDLGGPLKMAQIAGQQLSLGLFEFVQLVALFSINLGFINLLPIPTLDGGHLVFYAAEAVRRKPVSLRAMDWAFRGGLALLLALLVFVTLNDLASFGLFEGLGRLIG